MPDGRQRPARDARRRGYNAAGPYPINVFQANPFAAGSNMRHADRRIHVEVRLRCRCSSASAISQGFSLTANYTYGKARTDRYLVSADNQANYNTLRDKSLNWGPTAYDLRHIFQAYRTYDLPFGKDRQFAIDNGCSTRFSAAGRHRPSSGSRPGRPFLLTSGRQTLNQQDAGVVLNGITVEELQKMVNVRPGPNGNVFYVDESLIGADGRANPAFLAVSDESRRAGTVRLPLRSRALDGRPRPGQDFQLRATSRGSTSKRCSSTPSTPQHDRRRHRRRDGQHRLDDVRTVTTTAAIGARQIQFRLGFYF